MVQIFSKFYSKISVGFFVLTKGNLREGEPTVRPYFLLKAVLRNFKMAVRLRDWYIVNWRSLKILQIPNTLTLKQLSWKTKAFLEKLKFSFLVECTTIESARFPYKTTLSKAKAKKTEWGVKIDLSQKLQFWHCACI